VLNPPHDDPLFRARISLRHGAKADAVTAAIDEALKPWMLQAAAGANVAVTRGDKPKRLANLNDDLRATYGNAVHSYVLAWLHDRNSVDHGQGGDVPIRRIELMIEGIESLIGEDS